MIPRAHIETLPRTSEDADRRPLPTALAWTVVGFMILLTLSGSAIGAAATFGVSPGPLLVVLGVMLLIAAALTLAPRVVRARR